MSTIPSSLPKLMTIKEVAAYLRVCPKTVLRKVKSGELTAIRVGQQHRVRERDLQTYVAHKN